ncbi:MAG TPA: VWA domain-containing protein [Polyangiaceae bacterium]|nr:VWA domain-containing protein [Polyangiaceae bacterium]
MNQAIVTAYVMRFWMLAAAAFFLLLTIRLARDLRKRKAPITGAVLLCLGGLAPVAYQGLIQAQLIRETYVRFGHQFWVVGVAALAFFLAWRLSLLPQRMSRSRRALVVLFASLAGLAAALAVCEPELGRPLDRMTVIMMIDRSRSIDLVPAADARVAAELRLAEKGMHDDDRIGTIAFAAEAAVEDPPRPKSDLPPPQRVELGRDGTNLEAAVRRALAELPADTASRLVLVSDGVQTRGDILAAAATAVAADVPIDVVPLDQKTFPDVRVVSVRSPTHADEGEAMDLRVVTASTQEAELDVRVKRDGTVIHTGKVKVAAGEDVLRLREVASEPGLHRYDVEVSATDPAKDGSPEDNAGSTFVRVRGPALALILEGDAGKGALLGGALEANGFRTVERGATGVPADIGAFAGYDLVVLSDIRASDLSTTQIDALASYTRDLGGGLMLMGGDRSMGPGGYARTPVEEISPVAFDLKEEKRRASLAEVIAIDYSGSMGMMVGGQTKLALANEASARSASLLGSGDRLGVEHVDTRVAWTVPLGPVTDVNAIGSKIRAVSVGGGGIYTDVALEAGYAALEKETVNLKHLLLFADGDDAEQIAGCRALVTGASSKGMTTSVISLGHGKDSAELEVLSKLGGGRFYLIDDATKLPAVFTQETILAARSSIKEEPFKVGVGAPSPAIKNVDFKDAPQLRGYVVSVPKSRATVSLTGPEGDPILASWSVGIGRSAAFTSDFKDRWGAPWTKWPAGVKMMGQLGRDTARKADDPRVRLESDATGGELHVRADVVGDDGRAQTFRRLTVHVAGPDGFARDVSLEAIGAGRYGASVPLSRPGTYVATAKDEASGEAVGTTGAVLSAGEELRPTGSDRLLLARITTMTGGKMRDTLAGLYDDRAARRFAYKPLLPLLSLIAACTMLMGVAARRLGVPAFLTAMFSARARRARQNDADQRAALAFAEARERARAVQQTKTSDALLARKRKAAPTASPTSGGILGAAPPPPAAHRPIATPSPQRSSGPRPAPGAPKVSTAERLAQKRREKK